MVGIAGRGRGAGRAGVKVRPGGCARVIVACVTGAARDWSRAKPSPRATLFLLLLERLSPPSLPPSRYDTTYDPLHEHLHSFSTFAFVL